MDNPNNQEQQPDSSPTLTPDPRPTEEGSEMQQIGEEKSSVGSVVGIIVIIAVLLFAGLYLWGGTLIDSDDLDEDSSATEISSAPDVEVDELQNQGESDEVSEIATDLEDTELDNILDDLDFIEGGL